MAMLRSILSESFPPKPKFHVTDIPDLSGRVYLVTGGNAGLGKETCKHLLTHNAKVYLGARSEDKARQAIRELEKETGKSAIFLKLDLASLKSVKAAASEFLSKENALHVLFNNGGVMTPPVEMITDDGYDLQFGTNVLGHFYLTKLLVPALVNGAKTSSDGKSRVVTTSSSAMWFDKVDYKTIKDGPLRIKKGTTGLYAQSKFCTSVFAHEFGRRYGNQGIVSVNLSPGVVKTELQRHLKGVRAFVVDKISNPVEIAVLTQLYAGAHPDGANLNGKFLLPYARVAPCRAETLDEQTGKDLWKYLEEQVKNV
ncbi:NAD-P-binding protein [Crucibulum laeve]|uniref:NAD-P-binding protein n=1 Tax=Crucibulum laeve TaxID=68775 RepID=A0A5C3M9B7_9AGAR|nr:NAD-P-binding protein [Crucibulum laeve]